MITVKQPFLRQINRFIDSNQSEYIKKVKETFDGDDYKSAIKHFFLLLLPVFSFVYPKTGHSLLDIWAQSADKFGSFVNLIIHR